MIHNYDRSHWFGGSDAKYIFAEERNASWREWWEVKCGKCEQSFKGNIYTKAGNTFEHSILKAYDPQIRFDRQIMIPGLRLRVNLDGNTDDVIYEVKTYQINKQFKVTDAYFLQAQLQMFAWENEEFIRFADVKGRPKLKKKNPDLKYHCILAYGLYPDEYYSEYSKEQIENGDIPIDKSRIKITRVGRSRHYQRRARKILKKLSARLEREEM